MEYSKTTWSDGQNNYHIKNQSDVTQIANAKLVYAGTGGTAVSAARMNAIEKGIEYVSNIYGGSSTGNDTYVISLTNANFDTNSYVAGDRFLFKPDTSNTGACTLNINSKGAKTIKKISASGLIDTITGDIIANGIYELVYDGTYLVLLNPINIVDILTTRGDLIIRDENGYNRLGLGDSKKIIKSDGTDVIWDYENLTFIAEVSLTDDLSNYVEFTSIPSTYRHLKLYIVGSNSGSAQETVNCQINSDTGSNYWSVYAGATDTGKGTYATLGYLNATVSNHPSRALSNIVVDFPYYSGDRYKTWNSQNCYGYYDTGNARDAFTGNTSFGGNESVTAAISTIKLLTGSGYFEASTKFSLYGVR